MTRQHLSFVLVLSCLVVQSLAWWDWGHMLPLAILRYRADTDPDSCALKTAHIEKVEKLFKHWRDTGLYPMEHDAGIKYEFLGPLPDYYKWSDGRDNEFARGINEKFQNELHYFNQQFWLDDKVTGEAKSIESYDGQELHWGNGSPTESVTGFLKHLEDKFLNQPEDSTRWVAGTFLFQFSFYVHMMSDFHNPVHVGGSFAKCYGEKKGFTDTGANGHKVSTNFDRNLGRLHWSLNQGAASKPNNLHAIWDSMAWYTESESEFEVNGRTGYFGGYADDMAKGKDSKLYQDAKKIFEDFPPLELRKGMKEICELDSFFTGLTTMTDFKHNHADWMKDFEDKTIVEMAIESDEMNRIVAFGKELQDEYLALKTSEGECPKDPAYITNKIFSDTYIKAISCVSRVRVLLASYRLEKKLAKLIDSVDVDAIIKHDEDALNAYIQDLTGTSPTPSSSSESVSSGSEASGSEATEPEPTDSSGTLNTFSFVTIVAVTLSLLS